MNEKIGEYDAELCCWLYWKFYQKTVRGINIRKFKNFDKQREDVTKWVCFERLAQIANQYKINLYEYIPMVAAKYDGKFFHPKVLFSPSNLEMWNHRGDRGRELTLYNDITDRFSKSFRFVIKFCVENHIDSFENYLRVCIGADVLGMHIATGRLSKYFLCLLPDTYLAQIKKHIDPDIANQLHNMVIKHKEALTINTRKSLQEIKGVELGRLTEILNSNIQKNITKGNNSAVMIV